MTPTATLTPPIRTRRRGSLLGLPRTYWLLWAGMLVNRVGGGVLPFLAVYLHSARGLRPATAGLILTLYSVGTTVAGPLGGLLADRTGRRRTLVGGTVLAAVVMLGLGVARAVPVIALLAGLLGLFTDLCRPALHAAVADVVPPAERTRAYGLLYWAINLGFAGAAAFAGAVAAWSYGWLFVIDALTTLAFGAVVFVGVPETRPPRDPAAPPPSTRRELAIPFRDPAFLTFAAIQLPVVMVFLQLSVALPLDMGAHNVSVRAIGRVLALNGLVIVALQPLAVRAAAGLAHRHLLAAGAALTGVGFGICSLAGGAPVFALAIFVLTLGEIGFALATPAFLAALAPAAHRGGYQGAHQMTWGLAGMLAPVLGSFALQRFGAPALWISCAAVGLTAAVLHARLTGRERLARSAMGQGEGAAAEP